MNDIGINQLLKFFAVITIIAVLLVAGVYFFLRWSVNIEPAPDNSGKAPAPATGGMEVKIKSPAESELTPQIFYDGTGFQPARVTRDGSGSIGCLAVLINRSLRSLSLGVGQNEAKQGYGTVAAGEKFIFDPRFVGITELRMYNLDNPKQEFFIELGPNCRI
ncbi:MAG: hypothetical protein Q7R91_00130 [bacterium]|nr:hypothetical protein [bacterium]